MTCKTDLIENNYTMTMTPQSLIQLNLHIYKLKHFFINILQVLQGIPHCFHDTKRTFQVTEN